MKNQISTARSGSLLYRLSNRALSALATTAFIALLPASTLAANRPAEEEIRKGHIQIDFKSSVADIPFDRVGDCPVAPLPCE